MSFLITILCACLIALTSTASIVLFYADADALPLINIPGALMAVILSILAVRLMSAWKRSVAKRHVLKGRLRQIDADFFDYTPADKLTRIFILSYVGVTVNTYSLIPRIIVIGAGLFCIFIADFQCTEWNSARKTQYIERCEKEGIPVEDGYQPYTRWGVLYLFLSALSLLPFLSSFF